MPRQQKGILGVPKNDKKRMLFSFKVGKGEEWGSDSSDSDYLPSDTEESPAARASKKPRARRKRRSNDKKYSDSENDDSDSPKPKLTKRQSAKQKAKSIANKSGGSSSLSNGQSVKLLDTGGERYSDVWGRKIPPEILLKIFQCVTSMDGGAVPFLIRASKTCRLWWEVSRSPILWDVVDMSYGWIKTTDATLNYLCPDRLKCLRAISLNGWKNITTAGVQAIANNCPDLENINLSGCSKLNSASVKALVDKCSSLHTVDLSSSSADAVCSQSLKCLTEKIGPQLRSLSIGSNTLKGFNNTLNSIMASCPNLECFDSSNAKCTTDYFSLNIERFQTSCTKLRVLRFANMRLRGSQASKSAKEQSPGFPNLQELSLAVSATVNASSLGAGGLGIDDDFVHRILKTSSKLKLLDLRSCCNVNSRSIQDLPITDLQQLFISQCSVAHYEGIQFIMQKWQHSLVELDLAWNIYPGASLDIAMKKIAGIPRDSKLEILSLSGTSISYERVRSILEGCPRLKNLNLQSCRGLPRGMKKDFTGKMLEKLRKDIDDFADGEDIDDGNIYLSHR